MRARSQRTGRRTSIDLFCIAAVFTASVAAAQNPATQATAGSNNVSSSSRVHRLAWSQEGDAKGFRYRLAVDGASRIMLASVECVTNGDTTECSAPLPTISAGFHILRLVAIDPSGRESLPSALARFFITDTTTTSTGQKAAASVGSSSAKATAAERSSSNGSDAPVASVACAGTSCFRVTEIAHGLGSIDSLAPLPDGRILLLRDGRELLLLNDDSGETAYVIDPGTGSNAAIAAVAIDPDFARTRFVFLALVTRDESAAPAHVHVVRLREAGGRFGEAATVVRELPLADGGTPALAAGAGGLLFLSMPGIAGSNAQQPFDGHVIAFTSEGIGAGNATGSPIVARGPEHPGSIAMMMTNQIWVAAADAPLAAGAETLTLLASGVVTASVTESAARTELGVRSVAFTAPNRGALVTALPRALFLFSLSENPAEGLARTPLALSGREPLAVAAGSGGSLFVSVIDPAEPGSSVLLHLQPETAAQ
jgi:hypothetical protein